MTYYVWAKESPTLCKSATSKAEAKMLIADVRTWWKLTPVLSDGKKKIPVRFGPRGAVYIGGRK
jgi:hypothetical protein